jgi:DnaJ-class molecular chaperone
MSTQCETCSGKGYIHTTRTLGEKEYVERCDECYQEGAVSWTDEQAAEYARREASVSNPQPPPQP